MKNRDLIKLLQARDAEGDVQMVTYFTHPDAEAHWDIDGVDGFSDQPNTIIKAGKIGKIDIKFRLGN
jgi:hypothetical protein